MYFIVTWRSTWSVPLLCIAYITYRALTVCLMFILVWCALYLYASKPSDYIHNDLLVYEHHCQTDSTIQEAATNINNLYGLFVHAKWTKAKTFFIMEGSCESSPWSRERMITLEPLIHIFVFCSNAWVVVLFGNKSLTFFLAVNHLKILNFSNDWLHCL